MQILATTVVRHTEPAACSGRLLVLDVSDAGVAVQAECRLPENGYRAVDPNPRGGTRGLHGVEVSGDDILVTDYSGITVLNRQLEVVSRIEHGLFAGLHEMARVGADLWVVSTLADALLRLSPEGDVTGVWRPTDSSVLVDRFGLPPSLPIAEVDSDPRTFAGAVHGLAHMNSLTTDGTDLFVCLGLVVTDPTRHPTGDLPGPDRSDCWTAPEGSWGAAHAVVRLPVPIGEAPSEPSILWSGPANRIPNHDVVLMGESVWFSDTAAGFVRRVQGGRVRDSIDLGTSFARGLVSLGDGRLIAGAADPMHLLILDARDPRVISRHAMPAEEDESITSMAVVAGALIGKAE